MIPVQIKVYGSFRPVPAELFAPVAAAGAGAVGQDEPWLFQEGDMLRISFEGLWFPAEDVADALRRHVPLTARGKFDTLDLDAWTLTRLSLDDTGFHSGTRPLNQVLDYSGH